MADEANNTPRSFDLRTIKILVHLMSRHDLSEMDLQEGDLRIRLRRGSASVPAPSAGAVAPQAAPLPVAATPAPAAAPSAETRPGRPLQEIKSPTIGTFYAQAEPGSPPFVTVGSRVSPSTVVGLIEAMKVFNEITAGCSGVVSEVLIEDKQPVEYNQVLFRVDPTA